MEKLDSRLAAAAEFVGYGTVAADIGTDHGYLVCWLVENGVCQKAYATDINEKPLESAKNLISQMGLEDKIEPALQTVFRVYRKRKLTRCLFAEWAEKPLWKFSVLMTG